MNDVENYYYQLLHYASYTLSGIRIIILIYGAMHWSILNKALKIIYIYVFYRLFFSIVSQLLPIYFPNQGSKLNTLTTNNFIKTLIESNFNITNVFFYVGHIIFTTLFFQAIFLEMSKSKILRYFSMTGLTLIACNYIFMESIHSYGSLSSTVACSYISVLSGYYLYYTTFKYNGPLTFQNNSYGLISTGLFIQNLASLFIVILGNSLYQKNYILYAKTHIVHNIIVLITEIIIVFAFTKAKYLKYL